MSVVVLPRAAWVPRRGLPRRGYRIGPRRRTEVFVHHTAWPDRDATPNAWESLEAVARAMRGLQRARPDLGLDVPYHFVAFCMADGDLVLAEGRGLGRTGAHAAGHNRSALGIAFHGDFEHRPPPAGFDERLAALGEWLRALRDEGGFTNLGSRRPPDRHVWGHRDVVATTCPGRGLYARLDRIRFVDG